MQNISFTISMMGKILESGRMQENKHIFKFIFCFCFKKNKKIGSGRPNQMGQPSQDGPKPNSNGLG